jgi:mRNA-degrading endonuclease YafQ of YafQ-DinJ toxin-antitoxin module
MQIFTTARFDKLYKKLPLNIKVKAEQKDQIFQQDPYNPRLETHKLQGRDSEHWAYSIDKQYRIKFIFQNDGSVLYLKVGTHDEVY